MIFLGCGLLAAGSSISGCSIGAAPPGGPVQPVSAVRGLDDQAGKEGGGFGAGQRD